MTDCEKLKEEIKKLRTEKYDLIREVAIYQKAIIDIISLKEPSEGEIIQIARNAYTKGLKRALKETD